MRPKHHWCKNGVLASYKDNRRILKIEIEPLKTQSKTQRHVFRPDMSQKMASGDASYKTKVSCIQTWLVNLCLAKRHDIWTRHDLLWLCV